jgi:peroxiredoxin
MKKILLFAFLFCVNKISFAQEYEHPIFEEDSLNELDSLPNFTFYTVKDSIAFTPSMLKKDLPVLFISFNTECDHCQNEVEALKKNIDAFRGVQIIMVSHQSRKEVWRFYNQRKLFAYPIIMLTDPNNQAHKLFDFNYIPMLRQYNAHWKRIAAYNQQAPIEVLIDNFAKRKNGKPFKVKTENR